MDANWGCESNQYVLGARVSHFHARNGEWGDTGSLTTVFAVRLGTLPRVARTLLDLSVCLCLSVLIVSHWERGFLNRDTDLLYKSNCTVRKRG